MEDHSPSGLRAIPHLEWGSHLTQFFASGEELRDLLVPYFKAGLENNETCLWVTGTAFGADLARKALREVVPDLERRESVGQIEIADATQWYSVGQKLDPGEIVDGLLRREQNALAAGFKGLRTNGNCAWVTPEQWDDFQVYEMLVHKAMRGRRMICMCSYYVDQFLDGGHGEVMARHDIVLPSPALSAGNARSVRTKSNVASQTPRHEFQDDLDIIAAIPAVETILSVVCDMTGMGFSAVARVTQDRWVCCASNDTIGFGLKPGHELKIETTICNEIRDSREGVIIDHVGTDPVYCGHHTPAMYGFESYISLPILLSDGTMFGTLCAIDPKPAVVNNPKIIGMFKAFAKLIAFDIEKQRQFSASEALLLDERNVADLREQFIAVLGHDLRNPLMAIQAGARRLQRSQLAPKDAEILGLMQESASRASELVNNVLDFARGRMGGGFPISRRRVNLEPMLKQVAQEIRDLYPDRRVDFEASGIQAVSCDPERMGQLLSNLLSNALVHGAKEAPVIIHAATTGSIFELSVSNQGETIPPETIERLFEPFVRGGDRSSQGLGLGLFIASEIAKAHSGVLTCQSNGETVFSFTMPLGIH